MMWSPYRGDLPDQLRRSALWTSALCLFFLTVVLTVEGLLLWESTLALLALYAAGGASVAISLLHHALRLYQAIRRLRYLRRALPDIVLLLSMVWASATPEAFAGVATVRSLYLLFSLFRSTGLGRRAMDYLFKNPAAGTLVSFSSAILLGTILLALPRSTVDLRGLPLIDALFTATSAVCVTGLSTISVAAAETGQTLPTLSFFGQVVLLGLIQVGGLGIMTLSLAAFQAVGGLGVKGSLLARDLVDDEGAVTTGANLAAIVTMTLLFEAVGAVVLTLAFERELGLAWEDAVWHGVFHAVSAFCNAGFSTFPDNLERFLHVPDVLITVSALIVLGGLGFPVFLAIFSRSSWYWRRHRPYLRLPLHARVALRMTAILLVVGTVLLFLTDWDGAQAGMTLSERFWASLFQSVTSRTAGFNVVDMGQTSRTALLVYIALMFIGACPGGTAGGIKTTSLVVLLLSVRSLLRGQEVAEVMDRSIPQRTFHKAATVVMLSFIATSLVAAGLLWVETGISGSALVFEAVSAFGTVGLSMGATTMLDPFGKLLIVVLMFFGRVGPVTIVTAWRHKTTPPVRFPEGRLLVG